MTRFGAIAQVILIGAAMGLAACSSRGTSDTDATADKGVPYGATLSGREEAPPANSRVATGTASATYDKATKLLTWNVTFSDLTSTATAAHIHGPAAPRTNAPVVLTLTPRNVFPIASPLRGSARLTDAQAAELASGQWYVNIHTANNPNGELRGQLMPR